MDIKIIDEDKFYYNGRRWYSNTAYIKRVGASERSTSLAYNHVKSGKAKVLKVLGMTFFSPLENSRVEIGRPRKEAVNE